MAVKFKDLNDQLTLTPLTNNELGTVKLVESYLDQLITSKFSGGTVHISERVVDFCYNPNFPEQSNRAAFSDIKDIRKSLMRTELMNRYTEAGWKWTFYEDDGLDGPNMSGPDYWILGKK